MTRQQNDTSFNGNVFAPCCQLRRTICCVELNPLQESVLCHCMFCTECHYVA